LPNVTVVVSNKSVQTDNQGRFEVTGSKGSSVRFSFVGYKTLTVPLSDKLKEVLLTSQQSELSEVVVIGYGEIARKDLTGSVGTVSMENLEKAPVSSFEEGLAGRVAGVSVSATDGQPGQGMNIVIRGANSLTQSNAPLYVIDGFPIEDPDNGAINPDDIASINILKDASAAAIYGSRGANGVVIIETKKGKVGAPVVNFNNTIG